MRSHQRSRLLALLALGAALLALGANGCSKDEEPSVETGESSESASSEEGDQDEAEESTGKAGDPDTEKTDDGDEEPLEAPAKARDDASAKLAPANKKGAAATPTPPAKKGDKARDRVVAAKTSKALEGTDTAKGDTPAAKVASGDAAAAPVEGAAKAVDGDDSSALLSPAERRKVERERRIAELKRRNEERRKERMAKVDDQRREAEAEAKAKSDAPPRVVVKPTERGLPLKKYITQADVRKLVSNDTLVEEGGLSGIAPSERYNSVYFAPPVRSSFGISIQVWRDKTRRDANVRFRRMRAQYTNAEDTTAPTAKSFVSQWDDILTLSFANLTKRIVVSVSCSTKICKPAQLLAVAKSISDKL